MRLLANVAALAMLLASIAGCARGGINPGMPVSTQLVDGATVEITDSAVYSNCLSLTFSVRGFRPAVGVDPQAYSPPAKTIDLRVVYLGGELSAHPMGGGGGGGGDEEDGRIWMDQQGLYSLEESVPEGQEVMLEVIVTLDDDFGSSEPLRFQVPLVAGPGGGTCP